MGAHVAAVGYVSVHHGVAGTLDPTSVYNHPSAIEAPWTWALVHAAFILGLSACLLVAWNAIDRARRSETRAVSEAQDAKRQLHAHEKMAALGSLVAGLAHEVRTPLTVVATNASLVELHAKRVAHPEAARLSEHAREIQANVDRINALVGQLRRFHALGADDRKEAALDGLVREAVGLFASAHRAGPRVQLDLEPIPPMRLQALGVQQIVLNLVANATQAVDAVSGSVVVRTRRTPTGALLVVEDDGVGIPYESQAKVFDPLFTTKPDGMGLGLNIVKRIVDAHGGEVRLVSALGKGTSVTVEFPAPSPTLVPVLGSPVPVRV